MDAIQQAIKLVFAEFEKENGADVKLEDGDEFVTILNDGVLIIGLEGRELKVKFILGKPYMIDFTTGFLKEEEAE